MKIESRHVVPPPCLTLAWGLVASSYCEVGAEPAVQGNRSLPGLEHSAFTFTPDTSRRGKHGKLPCIPQFGHVRTSHTAGTRTSLLAALDSPRTVLLTRPRP